jgi:hypothetical protein
VAISGPPRRVSPKMVDYRDAWKVRPSADL